MSELPLKSIEISVAGRRFPVKVKEDEEETIRAIEKEVNAKLQNYKLNYKDLSEKDALSMTLLKYAFDLQKHRDLVSDKNLLNKIADLETELDKSLQ